LTGEHVARPNELMFNDFNWLNERAAAQSERYGNWAESTLGKKEVTIELGAGTAIPTVREESQKMLGATIRINLNEHEGAWNTLAIPSRALAVLETIDNHINQKL